MGLKKGQLRGFQSHVRHEVPWCHRGFAMRPGQAHLHPTCRQSGPPLLPFLQPHTRLLTHLHSIHTEGGPPQPWTYTPEPWNVSGLVPRSGAAEGQVLDTATDWPPRRRLSSRCTHPLVLTDLKHRSRIICGNEALSRAHSCYTRVEQTPAFLPLSVSSVDDVHSRGGSSESNGSDWQCFGHQPFSRSEHP